jgi:hypothetical protein
MLRLDAHAVVLQHQIGSSKAGRGKGEREGFWQGDLLAGLVGSAAQLWAPSHAQEQAYSPGTLQPCRPAALQPCLELEPAIFCQARYLPQNVHPLQQGGRQPNTRKVVLAE